jgi:IS4 transposase
MYSKTRFSEVLEGLPRGVFDRVVSKTQADKFNKGFRSWDQLIAMVYAHLSGCKSLRELEDSFNQQSHHHYHLGTRTLKRSTLSDANAKRNDDVFVQTCQWLMQGAHRKLRRELKDVLYLLDSSPIHLQGLGFDNWAPAYKSNVSQGLKLHLMLEATSSTPTFATITGGGVSDIKTGRKMPLEKNAVYVFDKGYYDYNWWYSIHSLGSTFVTRFKKNVNLRRVSQRPVDQINSDILEDAVVKFNNRYVKSQTEKNAYYQTPLRRIAVNRPDKAEPLILVTNDFDRSAEEIAALYKKRWDIELYFKWIKQNLKLKQFLGRSENAVRIQIYTALISYLLLQQYQKKKGITSSLKLCLRSLRVSLFQRPDTEHYVAKKARWRQTLLDQIQPELAF